MVVATHRRYRRAPNEHARAEDVHMDPGPCPACRFDPRTVSPADAAVAVRSYPRRFRALLVGPDGDEERTPEDLVLRRPPGGGWSALEHAVWVAEVLALAADALERIRLQDHPSV